MAKYLWVLLLLIASANAFKPGFRSRITLGKYDHHRLHVVVNDDNLDDFNVEKVLRDIAEEQNQRKEDAIRAEEEQKRTVMQKRKDKNYEKYWQKQEQKFEAQSKDAATMRSYYALNKTMSANEPSRDANKLWDYQAVPINPSKGDGLPVVALGLVALAALVVGKKTIASGDNESRKSKKRIRNAINMPGIGIVNVE